MHLGYKCEDLTRQTFPGESFDIVITQDVMEHVLDPDLAFREIARTLRPGGAHVFTTPIYQDLAYSIPRARLAAGVIEYLEEPEYHGNPIDAAGSLVTMHYGLDLPELIFRASGLFTYVYLIIDRSRGLDGEFLEVLVSYKPATRGTV